MAVKTGSLEGIGEFFITSFEDHRYKTFLAIWEALMETTPERTGTLRHNWRFNPYSKPGNYLKENTGEKQPWPREPDEKVYLKEAKNYTIYNNSPYIEIVNNGEGGNQNNQNFIEDALAKAVAKIG